MTFGQVQHNPQSHPVDPEKKAGQQAQVEPLLLAYLYLFQSTQINQQTVQIQAKQLQSNAVAQGKLINEEADFNFVTFKKTQLYNEKISFNWKGGHKHFTITSMNGKQEKKLEAFLAKVKSKQANGKYQDFQANVQWVSKKHVNNNMMQGVETENQRISAIRGVLEDQVTVLRQNAQVGQTQVSTAVNQNQQGTQEGSSFMQMIIALTNQITKI